MNTPKNHIDSIKIGGNQKHKTPQNYRMVSKTHIFKLISSSFIVPDDPLSRENTSKYDQHIFVSFSYKFT